MTATVLRHHREQAFRARYPWVAAVPEHMSAWLNGDEFFHHHDPEGLSLNAIAQALANSEAPDEIELLRAERAAIVAALNDADWPNEGESVVDSVIALLAARNELARYRGNTARAR